MNPLAVDYPPPGVDVNVFATNGLPFAGSFGDGLFEACTVPPGWHAEVVAGPAYGTVEFSPQNYSWEFKSRPGVAPPAVNTPDPFTYRLTDGRGGHSNTATVTPLVVVEV